MNLSPVVVCNAALDELPAKPITALGENTLEAKVCARQYPLALAELLEAGEWSFAVRRVELTASTNERPNEWGASYALPNDMAFPLRLTSVNVDAPYIPAVGHRLSPHMPWGDLGIPYAFSGGVLYAGGPGAVLEYITDAPGAGPVAALFVKALIFALATKIAMPITKDRGLKDKLWQEAELYRDRALAADYNKSPQRYGGFIPEVINAMLGGESVSACVPSPWPADGVGDEVPDLNAVQVYENELNP